MRGLFISLEGIDGAGKSSHIERLGAALQAQGRVLTRTREPGGTALAEQLRALVLTAPMDALTEALLVFAARRDHLLQVIQPALTRGETVLCDRFTDASFAYQGGGRGLDWALLRQLEHWVQTAPDAAPNALPAAPHALLQPDLTIWFDLPPAVAAQRLASARLPDRFESQPLAFFEQVAAAYGRRCDEQPTRFVRIQADQSQDSVWSDLERALRQRGCLA